MKLRIIIPLTILLLFSYLIFIFPFETISSWLGHTTSIQETILSTAFVYLVCLYYFRSKSSNKLIKLFVYEGMGIGTISLFIVIFILAISLVINISDNQKIFIYFLTYNGVETIVSPYHSHYSRHGFFSLILDGLIYF